MRPPKHKTRFCQKAAFISREALTGRSVKPGEERKQVQYLVQVCDPCQGEQFCIRVPWVRERSKKCFPKVTRLRKF
jgi:hypothetical protein